MAPWTQLIQLATKFNIKFPDVLFLLNVEDSAPCTEAMVHDGACLVPVLTTGTELWPGGYGSQLAKEEATSKSETANEASAEKMSSDYSPRSNSSDILPS